MGANVKKLRETLRHIESLPNADELRVHGSTYPPGRDVFDQMTYGRNNVDRDREQCGTAACFAGWRYMLDGHNYRELTNEINEGDIIENAAMSLGIDISIACRMFQGSNTLAELRAMVTALESNPDMDYWAFKKAVPLFRDKEED